MNGNILHSNAFLGNQWCVNNTIIPGETNPTYKPDVSGEYYVNVTSDIKYSGKSNFISVQINNEIPDFFNELRIFPNPSNGLLKLTA